MIDQSDLTTLSISKHPTQKREYLLEAVQWLPEKLETVFEVFADAHQLESITPPWLHFRVLTPAPIEMEVGTLIEYKLRLHGIPIKWKTEIPVWEPPSRFVDVQLKGPYRKWHHEHTFESKEDGTLVKDRVEYSLLLGRILHPLLVKRDLKAIFLYRQQKLAEMFSKENSPAIVESEG